MAPYVSTGAGLLVPGNVTPLNESVGASLTVALLESRIAELEARLQEDGWQRLGDGGGREFGRKALGDLTDLARVMYLKNPLVNRAVEVGALYVWGQDLAVSAADEAVNAVVARFWRENRAVLTGQQASRALDVELTVTGNLFLALFADPATGAVRVRPIPLEEVAEIVANPDDRYEPWFYRRRWTERAIDGTTAEQQAYYPDWRHRPADRPASAAATGGQAIPIRWESPVAHAKVGAFPHWQWGVSEVYAALDWARAYVRMLENDATRSAALARFAWRLTAAGGSSGVAAAKERLGTTLGANGGLGGETNPPPVAGATFIGGKDVGMDPIKIAGATLDPDHSRPIRLMTAAGLGIPETFLGDADVGNHATAKTLDRPTELRYAERRQMWRDLLGDLCQHAIDADLAAAGGLLRATPSEEARRIDLSWPDMLEPDVAARVDAVVKAATLGSPGSPAGTMPRELVARLLMVALGVGDVDGQIADLEGEWADQDARRADMARLARRASAPAGEPAAPREAAAPPVAVSDEDVAAALAWFDAKFPELAGAL